jgi:hypothetical protein
MHLITQPVHVLPCSNLAMKSSNGINVFYSVQYEQLHNISNM